MKVSLQPGGDGPSLPPAEDIYCSTKYKTQDVCAAMAGIDRLNLFTGVFAK